MRRSANRTDSKACRPIRELDGRLTLDREIGAADLVAFRRMPPWSRAVSRLMNPVTALRRSNRSLVYRF